MNIARTARGGLPWLGLLLIAVSMGTTATGEPPKNALRTNLIRNKLMEIIVPNLELHEVKIREVIDFLKQQTVQWDTAEPDPSKRGIGIKLNLGPIPEKAIPGLSEIPSDPKERSSTTPAGVLPVVSPDEPTITLRLRNIPLWEALRYVAEMAHLELTVGPKSLELAPGAPPSPHESLERNAHPTKRMEMMHQKLERIIYPKMDFRGASMVEACDWLGQMSLLRDFEDPDPEQKGVNVLCLPERIPKDPFEWHQIDMSAQNISLGEALRKCAVLAGFRVDVEEYAVVVRQLPP